MTLITVVKIIKLFIIDNLEQRNFSFITIKIISFTPTESNN
jgi:hypothetical protein